MATVVCYLGLELPVGFIGCTTVVYGFLVDRLLPVGGEVILNATPWPDGDVEITASPPPVVVTVVPSPPEVIITPVPPDVPALAADFPPKAMPILAISLPKPLT